MTENRSSSYLTPVTRIRQQSKAGYGLLIATGVSSTLVMLNSVFLILLSTKLSDALFGPRTISLTALVFQIATAVGLLWLAWRERRRRDGFAGIFSNTIGQRKRDISVAATITGSGQLLTLVSICWTRTDIQNPVFGIDETALSFSTALIVSWASSVISEVATFLVVLPKSTKSNNGRRLQMINTSTIQPFLSHSIYSSPRISTSKLHNPFSPHESPCQSPTSHSIMSLHSLTTIPRRHSRISYSIRRSVSITSSARDTPSPRPSGESAFDTWDTSSVPVEMRQAMYPHTGLSTVMRPNSARAKGPTSRLPPIPGSRPASPAKPLEGPFPLPCDSGETSGTATPLSIPPAIACDTADLPPSPTLQFPPNNTTLQMHMQMQMQMQAQLPPDPTNLLRPTSSHSSLRAPTPLAALSSPASYDSLHSALSAIHPIHPPHPPHPPRPPFARAPSLSSLASVDSFTHLRSTPPNIPEAQSQIHPLFRVTSPEPAPGATPGTTLTAAPIEMVGVPVGVVRASVERVRGARGQNGSASASANTSRPGSRGASVCGTAVGSPLVGSPMLGSPMLGSSFGSGSPMFNSPVPSPLVRSFPSEVTVGESDEEERGQGG